MLDKNKFVLALTLSMLACGGDLLDPSAPSTDDLSTSSDGVATYVADARNPGVGFYISNLTITQRLVSGSAGGYKTYALIGIDTSRSAAIPGYAGQKSSVSVSTDNIYWDVTLNNNRRGIVGGDVGIDPSDGHPTLNQYADINASPQVTNQSGHGVCRSGSCPSCTIDSGGEERNAVYTLFTSKGSNSTYTIVGGYGIGNSTVVFLIDSAATTGSISAATCSCPGISVSAPFFDWNVRAPPANATIPGNYGIYPTVGQGFGTAGTGALRYDQHISSTQTLGTCGAGSRAPDAGSLPADAGHASGIGSVDLVITPLTLSNGRYSNVQTTTVLDANGQPLSGIAVTMYENAGTGGGYAHGTTDAHGQFVVHDQYPGAGSYTEWSAANDGTQTVASSKITVVVP